MEISHYNVIFTTDDWQWPAITEKNALSKIIEFSDLFDDAVYIGFPWATLFDYLKQNQISKSEKLLSVYQNLKKRINNKKKIITVCQHIHLLKYIKYLEDMNITDVYWSHCTKEIYDKNLNINFHPFPLFPVKFIESLKNLENITLEKKYLASFLGAKSNDLYMKKTRNILFEKFKNNKNYLVNLNEEWFFQKDVYDHQIFEKIPENVVKKKNNEPDDYITTLQNSLFSFCPSGTGPNSIRLWESICFGSIPIILSDNLKLPGNTNLWENACIFCKEDDRNIDLLNDRLISISNDKEKINFMINECHKLYLLYGPQIFISDILMSLGK